MLTPYGISLLINYNIFSAQRKIHINDIFNYFMSLDLIIPRFGDIIYYYRTCVSDNYNLNNTVDKIVNDLIHNNLYEKIKFKSDLLLNFFLDNYLKTFKEVVFNNFTETMDNINTNTKLNLYDKLIRYI